MRLPLVAILIALAGTSFAESALERLSGDLGLPDRVDAAIVVDGTVCDLSERSSSHAPRFHVASISKLLTASVIAQLVEEDRLEPVDPVGRYLAGFEDNPVTIAELLLHTSGLRDGDRANGRDSESDVAAYLDRLSRQRQNRRGRWRYADANFNLLGAVIEAIEGEPYADVVERRLLTPLGMTTSTFHIERVPESARVQAFDARGRPEEHPWDLAFLPSAGLQSTAGDLALFAKAILDANEGHSESVLASTTLAEFTETRLATDWHGVGQAYGWQTGVTPLGPQWRHAGSEDGFESLLTIYPEAGIAVVVLGNQENWPRFQLERILREHAAELAGCPADQ